MTLVTILVFVAFILWLVRKCSPAGRLRKYGDKLPGPKAYPVIGNGLVFLTSKTLVGTLDKLCNTYGSVLRLWLGNKLWICLSNPADIAVFLSSTKHLNKSDIYRLLDAWLGTKGLVTSNADVWRTHRKLLTPSFHFKVIEDSVPMIKNNSDVLLKQLECKVNQQEFDILHYLEKCSFDIICEMAMGIKLETQTSENTAYLDSLTMIKDTAIKRMFQTWLHPDFIFQLTNYGKIYYRKLRIVKQEVEKVILNRRKALETQGSDAPDSNNGSSKKRTRAFLDFMLSESAFTNEEIENEVQTFMFAGHDTTTTTMSFCLYLLSRNEEIQDECVQEIKKLASVHTVMDYQFYTQLKYLENVIRETLRIYTTVPLISRQVEEDVTLPSGYMLPAGSLVNFNLLHMHNNEQYFPNAHVFNPRRFETRDVDKQSHFSFLPFSAGPRNCIGQKFAMLEMKVVLATVLLKYKVLPAVLTKKLTLETGIVLKSLDKIPVKLQGRAD